MAKKQNQPTRTKLEEFNDQLSGVEQKFEQNRKKIYTILGVLVALALGVWAFYQFYQVPREKKAVEAIGGADILMAQQQDSLALIEYEKVIKKYGGDQANRAKIMAGLLYYQKGDYKKAAKYLEDADAKGKVIGPMVIGLLGDCYASFEKPDLAKAMKAYDKAVDMSDNNPDLTPLFMQKKASILREQEKYADEAAVYQEIKDKFMSYYMQNQLEKNHERALAQAGK